MRVSKTLFILSAPENHPWDKWLQITSSPPWSFLCFFKMFWILNWYFFPWYPRKNIYSDNLINNYERQQSFFNINNWKGQELLANRKCTRGLVFQERGICQVMCWPQVSYSGILWNQWIYSIKNLCSSLVIVIKRSIKGANLWHLVASRIR